MSNVFGAFRTAMEEHIPVAIINDWNLNPEDLSKYKVLILPNAACLDDFQLEGIRIFVEKGGGLVASLDTSLFDEFGNPREDFALADLFGANYRGLPASGGGETSVDVNFAMGIGDDYWEKRKNIFSFTLEPGSLLDQGLMQTYVGKTSVTFKGAAVRIEPTAEAKVIGQMTPNLETGPGPAIPAVITHTVGKGRVVYFAAGFDSAYYLYPYPYQRLAIKDAINWAAAGPPPVQIDAPMCVQASVMRQQKDGERLLVHLFSALNTTAHHAMPVDDVPLREEVVPIHDIRLTFNADYPITAVRQQPENVELEMTRGADGISVTVPRLDVHSVIVAELQ
jgi:hypothetical protein